MLGSDMTDCEGAIAQTPFKRSSPNYCTMCKAGFFLLYPRDPLLNKGTRAVACVKPPSNSLIDCLVGHAFPREQSSGSSQPSKKDSEDPFVLRNMKLAYRCYVCSGGHPSLDLSECLNTRKYVDYEKKFNTKPFNQCSHGLRASANAEGICALCTQNVYSVIGDRLSESFGRCERITDNNKGCAKRKNGECFYCNHYRGYYMTYPNMCEKISKALKVGLFGLLFYMCLFLQ